MTRHMNTLWNLFSCEELFKLKTRRKLKVQVAKKNTKLPNFLSISSKKAYCKFWPTHPCGLGLKDLFFSAYPWGQEPKWPRCSDDHQRCATGYGCPASRRQMIFLDPKSTEKTAKEKNGMLWLVGGWNQSIEKYAWQIGSSPQLNWNELALLCILLGNFLSNNLPQNQCVTDSKAEQWSNPPWESNLRTLLQVASEMGLNQKLTLSETLSLKALNQGGPTVQKGNKNHIKSDSKFLHSWCQLNSNFLSAHRLLSAHLYQGCNAASYSLSRC